MLTDLECMTVAAIGCFMVAAREQNGIVPTPEQALFYVLEMSGVKVSSIRFEAVLDEVRKESLQGS